MPDSGLIHCFHSGALLDRAPGAPDLQHKKPSRRFGSCLHLPKCRQCGRKTACLGEVCDRCLKGVAG